MRPYGALSRRLDALAHRQRQPPDPRVLADARAVIAFGHNVPDPASSERFASWLARGGWRDAR
jgi:hypothetical protein